MIFGGRLKAKFAVEYVSSMPEKEGCVGDLDLPC